MPYCQSFTYPLTGGLACYLNQTSFLDKDNNQNEIELWNDWWGEQIQMFGMKIDYYVNGYALSAHDYLYGEDPLAAFSDPTQIVAIVDISNDSHILSKFGIQSTADITMLVHIDKYHEIFGPTAEPKSGDLIHLKEFGRDRPGGREGQMYEITERDDEAVYMSNQLMGHYIWLIKGTRFDYSFERGAHREAKMDQVFDNTRNGITESPVLSASDPKLYPDNTTDAGKQIFNYGQEGVETDVYGEYQ